MVVRYNPSNITSIRVFYKNTYLCQPVCQILDQESVSLKEIQIARNERRKSLKRQIEQRLSIVDAVLVSKQQQTQSQLIDKPIKTTKHNPKLKLYLVDNE